MGDVDVRKVGLGVLLLGVSMALIFGLDTVGAALPVGLVALGALGVAGGTLLSGSHEDGRPA
jgi:hypothetical protein